MTERVRPRNDRRGFGQRGIALDDVCEESESGDRKEGGTDEEAERQRNHERDGVG